MSCKETTMTNTTNDNIYDLYDNSPRTSVESEKAEHIEATPSIPTKNISPSIRLLFSFITGRCHHFILLSAIFVSILSGAVAPFMTLIIGQAFDAFAEFSAVHEPTQEARQLLLRNVGIAALELVGTALGSFALSSLISCLWIWIGELNVKALRVAVYSAVSRQDMSWYDAQVGISSEENPMGAAGIMTKFSRETDEIRMASSLASGMLIQYLTTTLLCLTLAFFRSWELTLVILSALPLLILIQGLSQRLASPLLGHERQKTGIAATLVERAISAISTVKAFNAAGFEHSRASQVFDQLRLAAWKLNMLWACTSAFSQFVIMAMFVQGFWFGSKLVRDHRISPGDVMAVFWACLIASSNLQMCIPQLITLTKGKLAMASLLDLVGPTTIEQTISNPRKITPSKCNGSLAFHNVTFAYPSRPNIPVLIDVSLFLPANEFTFIVGGSGSGKSTVAHLLQKMYQPQHGIINVDEWNIRYVDDEWLRSNIACIAQQDAAGIVIFDNQTIYQNIVAAVHGHSIMKPSAAEVDEACRAALLQDFVRDLPDGYDTILGEGSGVGLSGGQKQRLAIARAKLRNPPVLILDEATSALDTTSRLLIFEALKRWRQGKTTIVITHDLSQICSQDFVYVLKDGRVVEQGYRSNLEAGSPSPYNNETSEFRQMLTSQAKPGHHTSQLRNITSMPSFREISRHVLSHQKSGHSTLRETLLRPLTFSSWMFDAVADLTQSSASPIPFPPAPSLSKGRNHLGPHTLPSDDKFTKFPERKRPTTYSPAIVDLPTSPSLTYAPPDRRLSLPLVAAIPNEDRRPSRLSGRDTDDKSAMERNVNAIRKARHAPGVNREAHHDATSTFKVDIFPSSDDTSIHNEHGGEGLQLWRTIRSIYPSIPGKPLLLVGLIICLLSGAMTPVFSFFLSRLLFEVSIGAQNVSTINLFGGMVLAAAALDGFLLGLKYLIMETCGMSWVTKLRNTALSRVLAQDRSWFDGSVHAPSRLAQILVKDGDDARDMIAVVFGQFVVVAAMLGVGLIWAFIRGWQLTLAGLAIAPIFGFAMVIQSKLVAKCELRNKCAREDISKGYYDTIINIRGIRSMGFDSVFRARFDDAAAKALSAGVRGAFVEGCSYGLASGLIYLAEAFLFYVGALLIARGIYTYIQMIEVLNLVVFSVTIGSQLMAFTEKIAKSTQASREFSQFTALDTDTYESRGTLQPEVSGSIRFNNVSFAYPERPEAPVLRNISLKVRPGERIAIVGASGSGKTTIASLLQRLYEPASGSITLNRIDTRLMDISYLRENISIVTQQPHLFNASIADNIRYGRPSISALDVECAAKSAHLHDFIMSLPQGYATSLGENASLVSGGQAQRLQIARALARPAKIFILDECTSSLDPESQAAVLDALEQARYGRTMIMVTHSLEVMRTCDRILVVQDGELVEQGTYQALKERKGVFAALVRGGEWVEA